MMTAKRLIRGLLRAIAAAVVLVAALIVTPRSRTGLRPFLVQNGRLLPGFGIQLHR
jgi:hypothetical protein